MDNEFFLNAASLHFEPSSSSSMPTWHHQSLSSSMDVQIQVPVLNCASEQPQDCFFNNPKWDNKSTDHHHGLQFDSALSSMVSSPVASNSNVMPNNENSMIRELIGKLGNIGGGSSFINGGNSTDNSCYSTPLSSPPKMNLMNQMVKENLPSLGKSMMVLNSNVAEFSSDPGFAERAAMFSCFGSRSFNGRTYQLGMNNGQLSLRSSPSMENEKLARVSSSPVLKALGGSQMEVANSQEESTISEQTPNGENVVNPKSRKRKASSKGNNTREASTPKANETNEDSNNCKRSKQNEDDGNENGSVKVEEDSKGGSSNNGGDEKQTKSNSSKPPEPPKDYIHVRARRGQATDSHSLAERVRREKISERMKLLQDLVPGCNKVTGKALMLDEIINYVQSLQRQVEFLSMKLASVNTRLDFNIDNLISKDMLQSNNPLAHPIFPLDSSAQAFYGQHTQQNPGIHNNILNGVVSHSTVDPLETALCQNMGIQLPPLNGFHEGSSQFPVAFCEDDLNTIVQMGFVQSGAGKSPSHSQNFNGSNQVTHLKVEP